MLNRGLGGAAVVGEKGTSRRGGRSFIRTLGFWALSFSAPIAILCVVAAAAGVYPFGEQSFLTEDLKYQYIDFFAWYRRVLSGQESIFYSTACGLGANTWGLYSYYLASPFNFLELLFDEHHLTLFVFVVDALKLGCMQLAAEFYLRRRFGLSRGWTFVLGLGYTWSLWAATNLRNPMWMDALILLPLIMWAVWLLVSRGRWLPLALLTAANVIVCWYTAYMTVIFCVMLTIFEWAVAGGVCGLRVAGGEKDAGAAPMTPAAPATERYPIWRLALRFARPMVVALVLCAWTFVPTVVAMLGSGGSEEMSVVDILAGIFTADGVMGVIRQIFTTQPVYMLRGLIPALYSPWHRIPQFYCGLLLMLSFVAFFMSRRVDGRTKMAAAALVATILACVIFRPLQAIWCGFREPSGFYSRVCLFVAPTAMWLAGAWWAACLGEGGATEATTSAVGLGARLDALARCAGNSRAGLLCVAAVVVVDLTVGGYFAWKALYTGFTQEANDTYCVESAEQIAWLEETDTGTWRFERTYTRAGSASLNEAMGRGYTGLSSYSSAHNQSALDFLDALGYSKQGLLHVRYAHQNLAADALLGVKYSSSIEIPAGLDEVEGAPTVLGRGVYQNPYALSLGYIVADTANGAQLSGDNPFERQNSLASVLVGHDVQLFKKVESTLTEDADGVKSWQVTIPAGTLGYVYLECPSKISDIGTYLSVDGFAAEQEGWRFQHAVRTLGGVEGQADGTHAVRVQAGNDPTGTVVVDMAQIDCDFYCLDLDALQELTAELSSRQVSFSAYSGQGIDGTVEAASDGWAMISVPCEAGWTVTVNGREVQTSSAFGNALTLVPVTAGTNEISMHFEAPGLRAGCAITAVGAVGLLAGLGFSRAKEKRRCA